MTALYHQEPYRRELETRVTGFGEAGELLLETSHFYVHGGGQPGDCGELRLEDGRVLPISNTRYSADRQTVLHELAPDQAPPELGASGTLVLDWPRRFLHMRVHTALHLLSVVLPFPVTGGSIGAGEGRLDFDMEAQGLAAKEEIAAELNEFIQRDAKVSETWILEAELDAKPELVKTMMVKPPRGHGKIRLVEIEGLDLQPCGGTHVASTAEIGKVEIVKMEKKGAKNRRVKIRLVDSV